MCIYVYICVYITWLCVCVCVCVCVCIHTQKSSYFKISVLSQVQDCKAQDVNIRTVKPISLQKKLGLKLGFSQMKCHANLATWLNINI